MNTNAPSLAQLNGYSVNDVKFWLPGRVTRARRDDGSFIGETPASRDSQWRTKLGRQIPDTNFGMKEDVTAEYISAAHAAAGTGQPVADVQRRGRLMFDAVWADERVRLEAARDAARLKLDRAEGDRAILQRERDVTSRVLEKRDGKLTLPSGFGLLVFIAVALILVAMLASEWFSAATLRVFDLQSLILALMVTTPMVAFAIATKLLFRRSPSPVMQKMHVAFHVLGVVAALLWFTMLALNFAPRIFGEAEPPAKAAIVAFTLAQFIGGFFGSAWLTMLLTSMLQPSVTTPSNPDWLRMAKELRELDIEIATLLVAVRREEAELTGYAASRDAWIARGEEAFHRSTAALALIEERMRLLKNS